MAVGKAVDERLAEIEQLLPIGIELASLYPEDKIADEANNGFILNLIESLVIVILIIFVVMGSRDTYRQNGMPTMPHCSPDDAASSAPPDGRSV